jgi:hypothetical protein
MRKIEIKGKLSAVKPSLITLDELKLSKIKGGFIIIDDVFMLNGKSSIIIDDVFM